MSKTKFTTWQHEDTGRVCRLPPGTDPGPRWYEVRPRLPFRLTFNRLRKANVTRCEETFHPLDAWSSTDWACAMAGELGECCNEVKKLRRLRDAKNYKDHPKIEAECVKNIAKELADTIIYADLLAARLRIDLEDAVRDKFNEVSSRVDSDIRL